MFFRREKPYVNTFSDHLAMLREAGFQIQTPEGSSGAIAVRNGCAAAVEDSGGGARITSHGWLVGNEIGKLVDLGYQKIWRTPSGKSIPARAVQLTALHSFEEDLREALELTSLYNEALGTVNDSHLYDRVVGRDQGARKRPWDR